MCWTLQPPLLLLVHGVHGRRMCFSYGFWSRDTCRPGLLQVISTLTVPSTLTFTILIHSFCLNIFFWFKNILIYYSKTKKYLEGIRFLSFWAQGTSLTLCLLGYLKTRIRWGVINLTPPPLNPMFDVQIWQMIHHWKAQCSTSRIG